VFLASSCTGSLPIETTFRTNVASGGETVFWIADDSEASEFAF
jgi:hypothetical protein